MKTNFTLLKSSLMVLFLCLSLSSWGQTTVTYDFSSANAVAGLDANPTISLDDNISFSSHKNAGTSNPVINSGQLRLYQNATKGGSIKIYAHNGVTITNVTVYSSHNDGDGPAGYSIDNDTELGSWPDGTTVYTINNISSSNYVEFYNKGTSSSTRTYVDYFEVTYTNGTACEDSNFVFASTEVSADLAEGTTFTQTATSLNQTTAITYTSSDEDVATVNPTTGEVTLVSVGTTTITATQALGEHNGETYCGATITYTLNVIDTTPSLTVSTNSLSFTGYEGGSFTTQDLIITGLNLTGDITLTLTGDTNFAINPTTLSATGGDVTITYTPSATPASHSATLTVANGAFSEVITLSGVTTVMPEVGCFEDSFDDILAGNSTSSTGSSSTWSGNDNFPTVDRAYQAGGAVRLGNSSNNGSITSLPLTEYAGHNVVVSFSSKAWGTNASSILISFGTQSQVVNLPAASNWTDGLSDYEVVFENIEPNATLTFETNSTSERRFFIDNVAVCISASSPVTWTGTAWINGTPSINEDVVIEGDLFVGTDVESFEAKTLTVAPNSAIYIESGNSITVAGAIDNQAGADNFIVESGANLVQIDEAVNVGDITVHVTAETEFYGYNMFSSPVAGQTFADFSEITSDEILTYSYDPINGDEWVATTDTAFELGLGYMFAAPWTAPAGQLTEYNREFTGVPNNGNVTINVANTSFKALGNPYPSAIDADEFMSHNNIVGAIHIWRNEYFYNYGAGEYAGVNYITINDLATVGAEGGNIEAGQGFVVATDAGTIEFTNEMRLAESAGVFYKPASSDKHILWLNLYNENNMLNQIAVGYAEGATEGYDSQMDAKMFGYAGSSLYSLIANDNSAYVIQGRSLPFTNTDAVALGFRTAQAGTYTVSLADFNGLFANGQDIYLKDNATQTYHDLKDGAYTFVSEQGVFESRFEVVYQADGELSTNVPTLDNSWIVYSQDNGLQIEAQGFELKEVSVYDMLGRLIYTNQATGTSHAISNIANGVLIVKVITTDNQVLTRKTAK